jgi:hypothetical protein
VLPRPLCRRQQIFLLARTKKTPEVDSYLFSAFSGEILAAVTFRNQALAAALFPGMTAAPIVTRKTGITDSSHLAPASRPLRASCEIICPKVCPEAAAICFTLTQTSSSIVTVVRMTQASAVTQGKASCSGTWLTVRSKLLRQREVISNQCVSNQYRSRICTDY